MALVAATDDDVWQKANVGSIAGPETGAALAGSVEALAAFAELSSSAGLLLTANDANKPTPPSTAAHGTRSDHDGTNIFMRSSNLTRPNAATGTGRGCALTYEIPLP
jgi:hypothetical protein